MQQNFLELPQELYCPTVGVVDSSGHDVLHGVTPEFEIARTGMYRGKVANVAYCLGRRTLGWASNGSLGDVSNYLNASQSNNTAVLAGVEYFIRSTSNQDATGSTGIQSMRVITLDAGGYQKIITVALNGTTAVSLGADLSYVQYMESDSVGSSGTAVGDITIASVSGVPTVAQTIEKITAGDGRSLSGRVKVPKGFTIYLRSWSVSAVGSTMDSRLRGKAFTDNRGLSSGFHFQSNAYISAGQNYFLPFEYLKFDSGSEIKISAIPGNAAAGNRCDASIGFIMIADA